MAFLNLLSVSSRDALVKENEKKKNLKNPEIFDIKVLRLKLATTGRNVRLHKRGLERKLDRGFVKFTAEPESVNTRKQLTRKCHWISD